MAEPIRVDFQVGGLKEVQDAFKSIIQAAKAMGDQMVKAGKDGERAATETARGRRKAKTQEQKEEEQWIRANERMKNEFYRRQYQEAQRANAREIQQNKAAARALVQGFINAQEEKQRAAERGERYLLRMRQRYFLETQRAEERANRERVRSAEQAQAKAASVARSRAGFLTNSAGNAISKTAAVAGTLTGMMGGFTVADSVQKGLDARGAAADLANQSGRKVSSKEILDTASKIGSTYGMDTTEVIKGLDAFVAKSGDVVSGLKGLSKLTELATATGANMGDLLQTAGIIHMGTGDIDKTLTQMRVLAGAGREGSVDMRELSQYAGRISAGANLFTDKGVAFSQLSAIVQQAAATGGATAAPEATEAVTRLATDVAEKEDKFKALGIKTRDAKGKFFTDPKELIQQAIVKTKGDTGMLLELFGKMSYRAVAGFQDIYNRNGGGKAGVDAMNEAFDRFEQAALSEATVRADAAKRLEEADKKFAMVLNELRDKVAEQIIPVLVELLPTIKDLVPKFVELVKQLTEFATWFAKNPFTGLGAVILGQVVLDIANAGIGAVVKSALSDAILGLTGRAVGGAVAGAAGTGGAAAAGAGGAAAGAGTVAATSAGGIVATAGAGLVAGYGVGYLWSDYASEEKKKDLQGTANSALEAQRLVQDAKQDAQTLAPDEAVKSQREKEKRILALIDQVDIRRREGGGSFVAATGAVLAAPFSGGSSLSEYDAAKKQEQALNEQSLKSLRESLDQLRETMGNQSKNGPAASMISGPQSTVPMSSPLRASP